MAKSINLNPGADGVLVTAAYRAASANSPADYSDTLERMADGYDKTMQAQGKVLKNLATLGAKIGSEMMENAEELSNYAALGAGLDSEGADFLVKEIYANKDAQKDLGLFGGRFGDRETRQKRAELQTKQQELFAEIDLAAASIKAGSDAVAAGSYDANLNEADAEMVNAIIKSNLKDKHTKSRNYAKLGRDETTGELIYTLYNSDTGEPAIDNLPGGTGQPKTMTLKEFNNSIATNVDDKGALQTVFNTYNNKKADDGFKSRDGVYDEKMRALDSNWLTSTLKTPTDLRRAMRTSFGYSDTSFYDEIQKPSMLSAGLYKDLLSLTDSEGGVLSEGGIVEGVKDIDGLPGISEKDLQNATNYGILAGNILGMKDPDLSAKYFKKYTLDKFQEAYEYGFGKKPPMPGSGGTGTETDGFVNLRPGKSSNIGANTGNGYVPNAALNTIGRNINDRATIDLGADKFVWDNDKKAYTLNGETINNKYSLFSTIYGENFDPANIINMYNGIKDWKVDTRQEETFDEGTNLDVDFVNKADQTVAAELNDIIPSPSDTRNPNAYIFKPLAAFENMTGIYKEGGKIERFPEVYPEGHPKAGQKHPRAGAQAWFRTKGKTTKSNANNLAEMIDLLQTFGLYDSIGKQLP